MDARPSRTAEKSCGGGGAFLGISCPKSPFGHNEAAAGAWLKEKGELPHMGKVERNCNK